MDQSVLGHLAEEFLGVFRTGTLERRCQVPVDSLPIDDAYRVQDLMIEARVASGERVGGYKVGCTSKRILAQNGFKEPVCGRLMHPHVYEGDITLKHADFHGCAVEPEFVLKLGKDLPLAPADDEALLDTIEWVAAGIEVHHGRFGHGQKTFPALIASNCIHAAVVVGSKRYKPAGRDLDLEGVGLFIDDRLVASGIGGEILGGPLKALRWLIDRLRRRGEMLKAGQLVIPGSPVELIPVEAGSRVRTTITNFGAVEAEFR